jgi:segregation and condensation protein A
VRPPGVTSGEPAGRGSFDVHLTNFDGPFDLLLQLIGRRQLDITEVALSQVTDDFIAHLKAAGSAWDLDQTSEFIVVAATLLDLKAARLIPSGEVEDPEDLAQLEARDLLFARLLAYRAFKQVAAWLERTLAEQSRHAPRTAGLEPQFTRLLPEVELTITPEALAGLAARALTPKPAEVLSLAHLHAPAVSVTEQAGLLVDRLRRQRVATFRALTGDADRLTTVARFLALLELFREGAVAFEQVTALGELTVRWTGADSGDLAISDEFDAASDETGSTAGPAPAPSPEDDPA